MASDKQMVYAKHLNNKYVYHTTPSHNPYIIPVSYTHLTLPTIYSV